MQGSLADVPIFKLIHSCWAATAQCLTGSTSLSPSPACLRAVHHGRCFPYPCPPTWPSPSSCECDERNGWAHGTLNDPPPVKSPLRLPFHNADKQERDPFHPSLTQTWKPAPLPPHSKGNPLPNPHSTSCLTHAQRIEGLCKSKTRSHDKTAWTV